MRLPPLQPHQAAQQVRAVRAAQQAVLQVRAVQRAQAVRQAQHQLRCKYVYGS